MNPKIEPRAAIAIPPALVPLLDHLVTEYALAHKEEPGTCRRAVEIAVIQRGMRSLRDEVTPKANEAFAERMGWMKEEESGT